MTVLSAREEDVALCRKIGYWLVWVQLFAVFFMTFNVLNYWAYIIPVMIVTAVLLLCKGWEIKGIRVAARILIGAMLLIFALLLVVFVTDAVNQWQSTTVKTFTAMVCNISVPFLGFLMPGAFALSTRRGKWDRFVACFYEVWLTATVGIAGFSSLRDFYQWTIAESWALVVLIALAGLTLITVLSCALLRPREAVSLIGDSTLNLEE